MGPENVLVKAARKLYACDREEADRLSKLQTCVQKRRCMSDLHAVVPSDVLRTRTQL